MRIGIFALLVGSALGGLVAWRIARPIRRLTATVRHVTERGQLAGPGRLTVRCYGEGGWVVIEIDDTGPGISPEVLRKLFSPFYTTKPKRYRSGACDFQAHHRGARRYHHGGGAATSWCAFSASTTCRQQQDSRRTTDAVVVDDDSPRQTTSS